MCAPFLFDSLHFLKLSQCCILIAHKTKRITVIEYILLCVMLALFVYMFRKLCMYMRVLFALFIGFGLFTFGKCIRFDFCVNGFWKLMSNNAMNRNLEKKKKTRKSELNCVFFSHCDCIIYHFHFQIWWKVETRFISGKTHHNGNNFHAPLINERDCMFFHLYTYRKSGWSDPSVLSMKSHRRNYNIHIHINSHQSIHCVWNQNPLRVGGSFWAGESSHSTEEFHVKLLLK